MKALVLLPYFERPQMVRGALESLLWDQGTDWNLYFIDDGSVAMGERVVREVLKDHLDRVEFDYIPDTIEQKMKQGGSRHGAYMNERIARGTEDIVVCLCDDDALIEGYIPALLKWYEANPGAAWSYGKVSVYDPSKEAVPRGRRSPNFFSNKTKGPVNPSCIVDSSQVSFRRSEMEAYKAPQTANLDASIFVAMFHRHGPCPPNEIPAQYKAIHKDALINKQFLGKKQFEIEVP